MTSSKRLQQVVRVTLATASVAIVTPTFAADNLPEVVVTAQKREESLLEVSVAISAFTSEKRDQIGIDSVNDMTNFTPGLIYNSGQDRVTLRGIGRYTNQLGADSSVGVYEDGAFETFTVKAGNSTLYVDRIEVLRGPQGTLYGRNSIGGAINIISRRPTKDWYSEVRLSYDNYDKHIEEGAISGPITDNIQFRLVATKYDQTKGYFNNVGGGPSSGNVRDEWIYEGQLAMQFGDANDLWWKGFGGKWDNGGGNAGGRTSNQVIVGLDGKRLLPGGIYPVNGPGKTLTTDPLVPSLGVGFTAPVQTGSNPTGVNPGNNNLRDFYTNYPQKITLSDYYGTVLQFNHHFSGADLKYIGAIQHYNYVESVDWGEGYILATGLKSFQFPGQATVFPDSLLLYGEKHSFNTHEVNLISTGSGPLQWVAGVYNFNEYYEQPEEISMPGQAQLATPLTLSFTPAPGNPHRDVVYQEGDGGARTLAAYGQIDWNFTQTWKTTFGLRYSKDWKWGWDRARLFIFNAPAGVGLDISPVTGVATTKTYPGATAPWVDPATGIYTRRLEGEWQGVTGTAGMQWNPDADTNLYFKYSRGFKSGGFNIGSGIVAFPRTDAEHSNDFQIGFKHNFGEAFQLNIDLFYDQYENAQIPIGGSSSAGLVATQFYNVPESRSDGIEIETVWQATHALQFIFNYGYNDTSIRDSGCIVDATADPNATLIGAQPDFSCAATATPGQPQNLKGNHLPNAPKNKLALNTNYTFDLSAGALTFSASYLWRDKQYGSIFNRPFTEAPSWGQTDLRVQFKTLQDHLTLIAYGKNVFDQLGYSGGALATVQNDATGGSAGTGAPVGFIKNFQLTPPRVYGLELQYKF